LVTVCVRVSLTGCFTEARKGGWTSKVDVKLAQ
jgi:hypothetical protein